MKIETLNKTFLYVLCGIMTLGALFEAIDVDVFADYMVIMCFVIYLAAVLFRIYKKGEEWSSVAMLINPSDGCRLTIGAVLMFIATEHGIMEHYYGGEFWLSGGTGLLLALQAGSMKLRRVRKNNK